MNNHLPTCTPYCAKQHCKCGADAAHGSKQCLRCMSGTQPFDYLPGSAWTANSRAAVGR